MEIQTKNDVRKGKSKLVPVPQNSSDAWCLFDDVETVRIPFVNKPRPKRECICLLNLTTCFFARIRKHLRQRFFDRSLESFLCYFRDRFNKSSMNGLNSDPPVCDDGRRKGSSFFHNRSDLCIDSRSRASGSIDRTAPDPLSNFNSGISGEAFKGYTLFVHGFLREQSQINKIELLQFDTRNDEPNPSTMNHPIASEHTSVFAKWNQNDTK